MIQLSGKKVAVLGLGIEGKDLCQFLLKKDAQVTVFDQKEQSDLEEDYWVFKKQGINFSLGKDYLKNRLLGFEIIFRSPGFRRLIPEIVEAEKRGSTISSSTKLFFDLCPGRIIGVTGTKGKGTTTTLIYQILKNDGQGAFLAGNIGGPVLSLLPKIKSEDWAVLELSSFQLQDMEKSPHLAVVLFISSEHLDYHQDTKEYIEAKSQIVRHQKRDDLTVLNADDATSCSFADFTQADVFYYSRHQKVNGSYVVSGKLYLFNQLVGEVDQLQIRGQHNWENVCASIIAGHLAGASLSSIKKAVFSFKGLEHRLELVRKFNGVDFYNDSFSTTPETAIAAVSAFSEPIILIAGGSEKGSDFTQLGKEISRSSVKSLILLGEMADRIKKASQKAGFEGKIIFRPKSIKTAVEAAYKEADKGEVVLLSPACASFDMFKNYKERGKQFKHHVQAL